jgi:glutamyl-tRNA synthetase
LYLEIFDVLGWKKPDLIGFSRLSIKNAPISKRLLTPLVQEKKVLGWDDPRLPTLDGLKRRGILPEAIRNFVLSFGLSKVESEPDLEALLVENKKLLDPVADHYFFVADPVELEVLDAPEETVKLKKHPKLDHGFREIETSDTFFISRTDAESLEKDEVFRLKDLFNVDLTEKTDDLVQGTYAADEKVAKKFQWVGEDRIECEILVAGDLMKEEKFNPDSLNIVKGYCEKDCTKLEINAMIQFERFGFVRVDKKGKDKMTFIYSC